MIEPTHSASCPPNRPNLSNTLKTNNLFHSGAPMHINLTSDDESDSSSICHSPSWDDISGRKGRNGKREKKRRERELEKEKRFNMKTQKPDHSISKPRKLSKLPPYINARSFKSSLGDKSKSNSSDLSPQCKDSIITQNSVISPRKSSKLNRKPPTTHDLHSNAKSPPFSESQPKSEFIGGLKLRKVEEASIQEAIQQIKNRERNARMPLSLQEYEAPSNPKYSTTVSMSQTFAHNNLKWKPGQEDVFPHEHSISSTSPSPGLTDHEDYFNASKNVKSSPRTQLLKQSSWYNDLGDELQNLNLSTTCSSIEKNSHGKGERCGHDYESVYPQRESSKAHFNPADQKHDFQTHYQISDEFVSASKANCNSSSKETPILRRKNRPKKLICSTSSVSILRSPTEKPFQVVSNTIMYQNYSPLEDEATDLHHELSSPHSGLIKNNETTFNSLSPSSMYSSPDLASGYTDLHHDSNSIRGDSIESKTMTNHDEIKSSTSVTDSTQEAKHSFESSDLIHQLNPGSRFSHAVSTDSSEEYFTQDDISNITTPTESRPHSLRDKSPDKSQFDIQSTQVLRRRESESQCVVNIAHKKATDLKNSNHDNCSNIHFSDIGRSKLSAQDIDQPTQVTQVQIIKRPDEGCFPPPLRTQNVSSVSPERQHNFSWPLQDAKNKDLMSGLIKNSEKSKVINRPPNIKIRSDVSNCSQYLQEARQRIGSDVASTRPLRSTRNLFPSYKTSEPFAKMFVICCTCKYFHDMPSRLYACMANPGNMVREENLGVSGVITTSVKCPWCGHGMSTSCCAGYAAVVHMKERLH